MTDPRLVDEVWQGLVALVMESRGNWRQAVVDATGLPFSRTRVLRRLADGPLLMKELAVRATMDAPATTVAVNDLEERGYVVRETDPTNRRCKHVRLTEEGRAVLERMRQIRDPAPARLGELGDAELRELRRVLQDVGRP